MLKSSLKLAASTYAAPLTYAAALALALAWLCGIIAAPLLSEGEGAASLLYYAYSRVCHQLPERSFHAAGHAFGVCARCFGIYAGFAAGLMVYPFVRSITRTDLPARRWLLCGIVPLAVDFLGGYAGLFENSLASRASTGAIAGGAVAFYTLPGLVSMLRLWLGKNEPHAATHSQAIFDGGKQ